MRTLAPASKELSSTLAGRLVVPVATAGLITGWISGGAPSALFTVSTFALLGVSAWLVRQHLYGLRCRWSGPWTSRVNELATGTLELENTGRWRALHVSIHPGQMTRGLSRAGARLVSLAPGERTTLSVAHAFSSRGRFSSLPVTLSSRFPFGLFEARARFELPLDATVLPRVGRIRALDRLVPRAPRTVRADRPSLRHVGEEEFSHVRELREGEPARRIHHGLSARADRWIRRVFVAEGRGDVRLVLVPEIERIGIRRERDRGFEAAVSLTLSLGHALIREGARLEVTIGDGSPVKIVGSRGCRYLAQLLADVKHTTGDPWASLQRDPEEPSATQCVFVLAGGGTQSRPATSPHPGVLVIDADHPALDRHFQRSSGHPGTGETGGRR